MNKTLYSTAMDKVTMSDECLGEILDKLDYVQEKPIKKRKKVHYFQIVTAVAVLIFGTVTVAAESGGLEWVKKFFSNDDNAFESIYNMVSDIEDFKYESYYGINFTPIGAISDPKELYFVLSVDNVPADFDFTNAQLDLTEYKEYLNEEWGYIETGTEYIDDENLLICKAISTNGIFENGEYVQFNLYNFIYDDNSVSETPFGTVGFKISNISNSTIKTIDYSKYTPSDDYDHMFDKIVITPLSMETYGQKDLHNDVMIPGEESFKIVFNNGEEMNFAPSGSYGSNGIYQLNKRFEDDPIDPDNITDIYYKDMLIYHKDYTIIPNVYEMVSDIEDFECESDFNVKFSPVGLISDDHDFYCILHIDSLPENLNPEFISISDFESDHIKNDIIDNNGGLGWSQGMDYKPDENNIIFRVSSPQNIFKSNEKIEMEFSYFENYNPPRKDSLNLSNIAKASFTINSEYDNYLKINYKEYMPDFIPKRDYDFLFDEITITPLSISTTGRGMFYADELLSDGLTVVLSDGTEISDLQDSHASYGEIDELTGDPTGLHYDTLAQFEEPIDPNSITQIYLGEMLIYQK